MRPILDGISTLPVDDSLNVEGYLKFGGVRLQPEVDGSRFISYRIVPAGQASSIRVHLFVKQGIGSIILLFENE